jgi:peroxiredoxin
MLTPRKKAPALKVETLAHGTFDLHATKPGRGTVISFYRGLHCPICANNLKEFEKLVPEFAKRGVDSIAISTDDEERARAMAEKVEAKDLRIGYGLPLSVAMDWGLYISSGIGKTSLGIEEPKLFAEPGLFLLNPDHTAYFISVQSMPFVRPHLRELVAALDIAIEKKYPARGEYTGAV